jgi:hypothetical protein
MYQMKPAATHYLSLAFSNCRNFQPNPYSPSSNDISAGKQGAALIVECAKALIDKPLAKHEIPITENPPFVNQSQIALHSYLDENLGSDHNILFHVDEHFKICSRDGNGRSDCFLRGAMQTLASLKLKAQVVDTYVERPLSLYALISSGVVCREPIAIQPLDVNQLMTCVPVNFN